ncbi:T-complex protein 1 subunit alpha [Culex quinquefasciatus]|uniref:T-complex protein 1 subunit alpha n=1 Tax=Culex quinquefasciatus TaxID=7176 RepID=B0XGZ2_CULQU|nr:T-complex protein 1 subunit alpha [Culex quinquefasciatus]|eukprot:XP_001868914.1 T-complex protein 1 subunit alpha [Culex quinquefasciatus]
MDMGMIQVMHGRSAGQVDVTIDGTTILKAVYVDNPAAKTLVDMSRFQDDEVGGGTTAVTVLASELLREPEKLIEQKLHPQTIIAGWRAATQAARLASQQKEYFAKLVVDAVMRLKGFFEDSFLDEDFLLDKEPGVHQSKRTENSKILIASTPMDTGWMDYWIEHTEMLMACAVFKLAAETSGKESMAMEAFGRALLQLPTTIADNKGYLNEEYLMRQKISDDVERSIIGGRETDPESIETLDEEEVNVDIECLPEKTIGTSWRRNTSRIAMS